MGLNAMLNQFGFTKKFVGGNGFAEIYFDSNLVFIGQALDVSYWLMGLFECQAVTVLAPSEESLDRVHLRKFHPVKAPFAKKLIADKGYDQALQIAYRKHKACFSVSRKAGSSQLQSSKTQFWLDISNEISNAIECMEFTTTQFDQWNSIFSSLPDFDKKLAVFKVIFPQALKLGFLK